jgi:hypothetical protein
LILLVDQALRPPARRASVGPRTRVTGKYAVRKLLKSTSVGWVELNAGLLELLGHP